MVNLELYKVFYTVAKCGSLTKAAEELYISQPAVSQSIKLLETQLKTTLFHRLHKGMELTAQGGALIFPEVERALRLLESAENKLSEVKQVATGTLRIGASETIFRYLLSDKIVEFHKRNPSVKVEMISDVSPRIADLLRADKCDIGFLNLPYGNTEGIELIRPIALLEDIFVAGEEFSSLKGKSLEFFELSRLPLLLMEEHTVARAAFDHFAKSLGVELTPTVEVNSWEFMQRLVAKGMGVGCIPRRYVELGEGSGLFELNVSPRMPVRSVSAALPENSIMPYALRSFLSLFEEDEAKK